MYVQNNMAVIGMLNFLHLRKYRRAAAQLPEGKYVHIYIYGGGGEILN